MFDYSDIEKLNPTTILQTNQNDNTYDLSLLKKFKNCIHFKTHPTFIKNFINFYLEINHTDILLYMLRNGIGVYDNYIYIELFQQFIDKKLYEFGSEVLNLGVRNNSFCSERLSDLGKVIPSDYKRIYSHEDVCYYLYERKLCIDDDLSFSSGNNTKYNNTKYNNTNNINNLNNTNNTNNTINMSNINNVDKNIKRIKNSKDKKILELKQFINIQRIIYNIFNKNLKSVKINLILKKIKNKKSKLYILLIILNYFKMNEDSFLNINSFLINIDLLNINSSLNIELEKGEDNLNNINSNINNLNNISNGNLNNINNISNGNLNNLSIIKFISKYFKFNFKIYCLDDIFYYLYFRIINFNIKKTKKIILKNILKN